MPCRGLGSAVVQEMQPSCRSSAKAQAVLLQRRWCPRQCTGRLSMQARPQGTCLAVSRVREAELLQQLPARVAQSIPGGPRRKGLQPGVLLESVPDVQPHIVHLHMLRQELQPHLGQLGFMITQAMHEQCGGAALRALHMSSGSHTARRQMQA